MVDNISSLLDLNLDDLDDLPEFVVPPAGSYSAVILSCEEKMIGTHPAVEMKFKLLETMELANPSEVHVADGTECGVAFMLDNKYGVGDMKASLAPIKAALGTTSARETMAACKGLAILLVTKIRTII